MSHFYIFYAQQLVWHVRIELAQLSVAVSGTGSGMCELTNQRLAICKGGGLKETGAFKTEGE